MIVTNEFLKLSNVPDIGSISIYPEDCINESKNITPEKIENIMFPEMLSHLQQELKSWHDKLSHLHPKSMFILAKLGFLPSEFIDLNDFVPLCAPCMFETEMRRQWITKGNKSGSTRK